MRRHPLQTPWWARAARRNTRPLPPGLAVPLPLRLCPSAAKVGEQGVRRKCSGERLWWRPAHVLTRRFETEGAKHGGGLRPGLTPGRGRSATALRSPTRQRGALFRFAGPYTAKGQGSLAS